jgi:multicomponent Na+:H+ antiporter subunit E
MTRVLWLLPLTLMYALALASFAPWDIAAGLIFSAALLLLFRQFVFEGRPAPPRSLPRRVAAAVPFAARVLMDMAAGTWQVALVILRLRPLRSPGIVAVPIGDCTPTGVAVMALVTTLSPGSYLVEIDWERRVMLYHVLDARDPDAVRAAFQHMYERYQRHVFP